MRLASERAFSTCFFIRPPYGLEKAAASASRPSVFLCNDITISRVAIVLSPRLAEFVS